MKRGERMALLYVKTNYADEFTREVQKYKNKLDDIWDHYNDAANKVSPHAGDSLIYSSYIYLNKRKRTIEEKIAAADSLNRRVQEYVNRAIAADEQVRSSIHTKAYSFYKETGIGPQKDTWYHTTGYLYNTTIENFFRDAVGTGKQLVGDIKTFIAENEFLHYAGEVLKDVVAFAGAVAIIAMAGSGILGVICIVGGCYLAASSLFELGYDMAATKEYVHGNEKEAEKLSKKELGMSIVDGGEWLDQKLGTNFIETSVKIAVGGLEVCGFVAATISTLTSIKGACKLDKFKSVDFFNNTNRTWGQNMNYLKNIKWGKHISQFTYFSAAKSGWKIGKSIRKFGSSGETLGEDLAEIILA